MFFVINKKQKEGESDKRVTGKVKVKKPIKGQKEGTEYFNNKLRKEGTRGTLHNK